MDDDRRKLIEVIETIHVSCFKLCKLAIGKYLQIVGNVGVFCQSDREYKTFLRIKNLITFPSDNPSQKYFQLKEPITIHPIRDIPETKYTYLYIRKPDQHIPQLGDVDFILPRDEFEALKQRIVKGEKIPNAKIYDRVGWNMVELINSNINAIAYISYKEMAEKVRIRFD